MQKTLLLIGARGFAGSQLLETARQAGVRVVPAGRESMEGTPACDLLDPAAAAACLEAVAPDLIVNAAGVASVAESWKRPAEAFAANAAGVHNLLEAVASKAPAAHVLCISSAEVYGEPGTGALPLSEDLEPRPVSPYGAAKAEMEALCGQYARDRGLRIGIVRAFNLFGPGQPQRFAASGFARRIAAAERDGDAAVQLRLGNPTAARDFTDVRDAARALLELSRWELCGTFNLCSGRALTIAELAEGLAALSRVPVHSRQEPALERPADPPALVGDPSRLREATGYEPAIGLSQSLSDLLEWWRAELAAA